MHRHRHRYTGTDTDAGTCTCAGTRTERPGHIYIYIIYRHSQLGTHRDADTHGHKQRLLDQRLRFVYAQIWPSPNRVPPPPRPRTTPPRSKKLDSPSAYPSPSPRVRAWMLVCAQGGRRAAVPTALQVEFAQKGAFLLAAISSNTVTSSPLPSL